jgi:hypothetical protein
MAKSVKIRLSYVVSDNTDYSNPKYVEFETTSTPDEVLEWRFQVDAGATTVATGTFATIADMIVYNNDTTESITLAYTSLAGATAQEVKILADEHVHLVDIDPATSPTLTGTGACYADVIIMGS